MEIKMTANLSELQYNMLCNLVNQKIFEQEKLSDTANEKMRLAHKNSDYEAREYWGKLRDKYDAELYELYAIGSEILHERNKKQRSC